MFKKDEKVPEGLVSFFNYCGGSYGVVKRKGPFRIYVVAKTRNGEYPSYIYIDPGYDNFPFKSSEKASAALMRLTYALRAIGLDIDTEQVCAKEQDIVCSFSKDIEESEVVASLSSWGVITQQEADALETASPGFSERHLEPVTKEWRLRV